MRKNNNNLVAVIKIEIFNFIFKRYQKISLLETKLN